MGNVFAFMYVKSAHYVQSWRGSFWCLLHVKGFSRDPFLYRPADPTRY